MLCLFQGLANLVVVVAAQTFDQCPRGVSALCGVSLQSFQSIRRGHGRVRTGRRQLLKTVFIAGGDMGFDAPG
jgi:hypothetical protein